MKFDKVRNIANQAMKNEQVIGAINSPHGLLCSIDIVYEVAADLNETFSVRRTSRVFNKIRDIILEDLKAENKDFAESIAKLSGGE